jgi:hypothetical protein
MHTQLDREEQWIAKYRAALDASPSRRVSLLEHFVVTWQRVSEKLAGEFRRTLSDMPHVMNLCRLGKGWVASLPMHRLRRQS